MTDPVHVSNTPDVSPRWWIVAAVFWLVFVGIVAAHHVKFWTSGTLATDVMALLPENEQAKDVTAATSKLAQASSRQIVVMVGAADWESAKTAASAYRATIVESKIPVHVSPAMGSLSPESFVEFYGPFRDKLLTPEQRARLTMASASVPAVSSAASTDSVTGVPTQLVQAALANLYRPGVAGRMSSWANDPLDLFQEWVLDRAGQSRARVRDGELGVFESGSAATADKTQWVVMLYEIDGAPFSLSGNSVYSHGLRAAEQAARDRVPEARFLAAGLPLHAEAAAIQANTEINEIGWGSLLAVVLLVWFSFRTVRSIFLVALSLLVGTAVALSVTVWVFGEIHLLTLVFGASLIGVAEDYGIHYFASRQSTPTVNPRSLMRQLLPGLTLALATSVIAYLLLGIAPFPGLRQMALFSATGLVAAFLTAACWFPLLDKGSIPRSSFAAYISATLHRWPRVRLSRRFMLMGLVLTAFCAAGVIQLFRTGASDDIRTLQSSPPELIKAQLETGRLLGTPSIAQFYLVRGATEEEVLRREERLKTLLADEVVAGRISGWNSVSDWVPSRERQASDAKILETVEAEVVRGVNEALGETIARPPRPDGFLEIDDWLSRPVSAVSKALWLGRVSGEFTSVVMLRGLHDLAALPHLASAAEKIDGVRWVDKAAETSNVLGRYRVSMTYLLLAGHVVVLFALWLRYRRNAWRAWAPTAIASVVTLAALGFAGYPFQLFNVLALTLLLGIGVDYGIFLLEHEADGSAWLAVVVGAASTWLSFGLLALSKTPALHTFGLTLLIGIALVWGVSPMLRVTRPSATGGNE